MISCIRNRPENSKLQKQTTVWENILDSADVWQVGENTVVFEHVHYTITACYMYVLWNSFVILVKDDRKFSFCRQQEKTMYQVFPAYFPCSTDCNSRPVARRAQPENCFFSTKHDRYFFQQRKTQHSLCRNMIINFAIFTVRLENKKVPVENHSSSLQNEWFSHLRQRGTNRYGLVYCHINFPLILTLA